MSMQYEISGPKRFIAGAVCPQCKGVDKTVTFLVKREVQSEGEGFVEIDDEIMACVSCSYEQSKLELSEANQRIVPEQADIIPLRIVDAAKAPKR